MRLAPNRKSIAAIAGAILLTLAYPLAIEQGWFRHNPYLLPALLLGAIFFYLAFFLSHPALMGVLRGFVRRRPMIALATFLFGGAIIGTAAGGAFWYSLRASQHHLETLDGENRASRKVGTTATAIEHENPKLSGEINSVFFGNVVEGTRFFLLMTIRNNGAPSAVDKWDDLIFKTPTGTVHVGKKTLMPDHVTLPTGKVVRFEKTDSLYEKTTTPVPRYGFVRGWMHYFFPGIHVEIGSEIGGELRAGFSDALGNPSTAVLTLTEATGRTPMQYYPGSTQPFKDVTPTTPLFSASPPPPAKNFTRRTPRELLGLYVGRTALQGDALIRPFVGQWIRSEATIIFLGADGQNGSVAAMRRFEDPGESPIECRFSQEWTRALARLNNGDTIRFQGKIGPSQNGQQLYLSECELLETR